MTVETDQRLLDIVCIYIKSGEPNLTSLMQCAYTLSRFWPSCISGTSHAPCREVPSALLPVCSAVA